MTQMRIKEAAALLGVSDDTLRRWIDAGRLETQLDSSGRKVVRGLDLARLSEEINKNAGADLDPTFGRRSARNQFTGLVTALVSDAVVSQVSLQCGPYRVVSLVSTEAVKELGLELGSVATAIVKATNVSIEIPGGRL
ncbi:MAG: TOBE domain-containing protein [Dermatophilaceae bacterium]